MLTSSGASYYRARYYDPTVGRFLSEDPIGFWVGGNFYAYVRNHSSDLVDPSGLLQVCCRGAHNGPSQFWASVSLAPPPCHCFLKLADGTTLGGYHNWSWSGSMGGLDLRRNDPTDHDKYAPEAKCSDVPGSPCLNDRALKNVFGARPVGGYGFSSKDYGTSNDAAAGLLKDAGISFTLPACAWGKGTGTIPMPNFNPGGGFPLQFMP